MKNPPLLLWILAALLLAILITIPAAGAAQPVTKPVHGWVICQDLGTGLVPGTSLVRQRFEVCNGDGWKILAYCTEVGKAAPPVNTMCSFTDASHLWCGEAFQMLMEYRVQATPPPTLAPSATLTPTLKPSTTGTQTPSPTRRIPQVELTPTFTLVFSATASLTPTATATFTPTATLTSTVLPSPTGTHTPSPTPRIPRVEVTPTTYYLTTPTPTATRTRPGGPGNLDWAAAGETLAAAALLAMFAAIRTLRKKLGRHAG